MRDILASLGRLAISVVCLTAGIALADLLAPIVGWPVLLIAAAALYVAADRWMGQ